MTAMRRREFLGATAATGAGVFLSAAAGAKAGTAKPSDEINLAVIGFGSQGRNLIDTGVLIPKVRFRAICDIWPYRRQYGINRLKTYNQAVNVYADYHEMLDKEKGLDAVLIATPNSVHAEQTNACLAAGLHVYCESMMAHSTDAARSMIRTAKETGKLLQIGYQRRSNPCYRHVVDELLREAELPEQITQVQTRWTLGVNELSGWPRRHTMPDELLRKYGYDNMREFRNWPWFWKFGAGLAAGLMAHQLDVVNWFLDAVPNSILAAAGVDYYESRETFDNLTAIYQYKTTSGTIRVCTQVLTDTRADGIAHFEQFCGTEGTIRMSENPNWTSIFQDPNAVQWDEWVEKDYIKKTKTKPAKPPTSGDQVVEETGKVESYAMPALPRKPPLQPHLENFLDAIRGKVKLNCPAELAFRGEFAILKTIEATRVRRAIDLSPEDFSV